MVCSYFHDALSGILQHMKQLINGIEVPAGGCHAQAGFQVGRQFRSSDSVRGMEVKYLPVQVIVLGTGFIFLQFDLVEAGFVLAEVEMNIFPVR